MSMDGAHSHGASIKVTAGGVTAAVIAVYALAHRKAVSVGITAGITDLAVLAAVLLGAVVLAVAVVVVAVVLRHRRVHDFRSLVVYRAPAEARQVARPPAPAALEQVPVVNNYFFGDAATAAAIRVLQEGRPPQ